MESDLQKSIANFLDNQERLFKSFTWFHPPNGGRRDKSYARFLAGQGVKAGVPDIVILTQHGGTILIELKYKKNSLQDTQEKFHAKLRRLNHPIYTIKAEFPHDAVNQVEAILRKEEVL